MATMNSSNIKDAGIVYCDGAGVFAGNNLSAVTNTIASTDTNGDVILSPNGTGGVVAATSLTVGNPTKDVAFTINGASTAATISAEGLDAAVLGGILSHRHSSTAGFGGHFIGLRSRGTHASPTVVSDDDTLGILAFAGHDGTDYAQAAQILIAVDGTPGSDDMPGRIALLTSADGSQTPAEAMRITSEQKIGIGITAPIDTLHIVGNIELDHTATESDDHAIEMVCDAAGFGDVKALDIDYITGNIAATDDEECILLNIDESASSGGIVNGYEVLTTTEGSATINGYTTGIGVNPIVHESGTFGDADNILNKAVDVTAALASGGAGSISIFVADNDTFTIGDAATWDEFEIILGTGASGSGVAPTWEYSTGGASYTAFSPGDGTNGFRNTGAVLWDSAQLAGWATATSGDYEIRITRTRNSLSTTPIIDKLQISATTEYSWDKNGALTVASLALTTDLSVANGGTGVSTLLDNAVLVGSGTAAITALTVGTNGQLLVGSTGADPVFATAASSDGSITYALGAGTFGATVTAAGEAQLGGAELATQTETNTGTDDVRIVTPLKLKTNLASPPAIGGTAAAAGDFTVVNVDNVRLDGDIVSYAGTAVLTLHSIGAYTAALQPLFIASKAAAQANVTGNNTAVTVTFATEITDQNADYDGSATFTSPLSGSYPLYTHFDMNEVSGMTTGIVRIRTSNRQWGKRLGTDQDSSARKGCELSVVADMDAADTAFVEVVLTGIGADTADIAIDGGTVKYCFAGCLQA